MSSLADRLAAIHVRASVSGGDIAAELRNGRDITLSFEEGIYDNADEYTLSESLERLARLLWARWRQQYLSILADIDFNVGANDQHDLNFIRDRDEVEATGKSSSKRVTITTVGMVRFEVDVAPDTVEDIYEDEFADDVSEAARDLISNYQIHVRELKKRYYG